MNNILPKIPKDKRNKLEIINAVFIIVICVVFYFCNLSYQFIFMLGLPILIIQIIVNIIFYNKHKIRWFFDESFDFH